MWRRLTDALSPSGATDRGTYRVAVLAFLAAIVGLCLPVRVGLLSGAVIAVPLLLCFAALGLLTVRRFRDAALPTYWVAMMLFPVAISWNDGTPQLSFFSIGLGASHIVNLVPVMIGLFAAGGWRASAAGASD